MERRLGRSALERARRQWRSVRGDSGWLTTYWYRPERHHRGEARPRPGRCAPTGSSRTSRCSRTARATATVTVRTAQPPTAPPSVMLRHAAGRAGRRAWRPDMCGPMPRAARHPARARTGQPADPDRPVGCADRQGGRRRPVDAAAGRSRRVQPGAHRRRGRIWPSGS